MDKRIAEVRREMRAHPERFDFGDLPDLDLRPALQEQSDRMRPDWLKEGIAKAQAAKRSRSE